MTSEPPDLLMLMDQKISAQNRLLDDKIHWLRWYVTALGALASLIPAALIVFVTLNFNWERDSLKEFRTEARQEIREVLGKGIRPPEVVLFGPDQKPLAGQVVPARLTKDQQGKWQIVFTTIERNLGGSSTGPRFYKLYAPDALVLSDRSTDEPDFKYETYINPNKVEPRELPGGGYSQNSIWTYELLAQPPARGSVVPVLLKVYYGNERVSSVRFGLRF